MMHCHGRDMNVVSGDARYTVRGFLQPVISRAQRLARPEAGPLGMERSGQYVYIGPVVPELNPRDEIHAGEKTYRVQHAQLIWEGDAPFYCWAMCTEKGGEDVWGLSG